jgi:hemoglobin-like flavoprotein
MVSERCGDVTSLVYERLFAEYPQMKALFWR